MFASLFCIVVVEATFNWKLRFKVNPIFYSVTEWMYVTQIGSNDDITRQLS